MRLFTVLYCFIRMKFVICYFSCFQLLGANGAKIMNSILNK
ncbi:conserved domain protein [Bacteroides fluxus YIT 12057]|uniref:Conserved domain protein n=1 Tax=Bacteroides fluxus YIT 12057 TaxID=763034 RepID=F3PU34_9BACE|nr:conserved domain protein [Bacteroides fluxus YIT 12057]